MLLSLEHINKFYNGNQILKNIELTIENNDRIGLIGVNGCGKTTLLRILMGEEEFDKTEDGKGSISVSNNVTIGILKQNSGLDKSNSIKDEMRSVFKKQIEAQEKMRELESSMADTEIQSNTEEYKKISDEYAVLSSWFEAHDGYNINVKIRTILNGMGFASTDENQIINTLSGGEKTRLALAKLLLESPTLLILDEPTNHLDFKTLLWLEDYLASYKGGLLIVSHDRYFLNKLCTRICEIENHELISYKGDYTSYVTQKEMRIDRLTKKYEKQQQEIASLKDYIDRNKVRASTANMAKSRQAQLNRIDVIDKPFIYNKPPKIRLEYDIVPPKIILKADNINVTVGQDSDSKVLCENISFEIRRGEKIGIVGPNGIGKSSILKVLLGKIPHTKGKIEWCQNAKISFFDQENSQLDFNNTVMEELHRRYPRESEQYIRSLLGKVLLTGENVFKKVSVISGGERAKLCFAIMMHERGNILILDEPTNHLDLTTKEVLEDALETFDGTIIFVSHDRYLLNRVASKIFELDNGMLTEYKGNFDFYYDAKKQEEQLKQAEADEKKTAVLKEQNAKIYKTKQQRAEEAKKKSELKQLEIMIDELSEKIDELEKELLLPEIYSDYEVMNKKYSELNDYKQSLSEFYDKWEKLSENI